MQRGEAWLTHKTIVPICLGTPDRGSKKYNAFVVTISILLFLVVSSISVHIHGKSKAMNQDFHLTNSQGFPYIITIDLLLK